MSDYAISTNLISWVPAHAPEPFFGWPRDQADAELVDQMKPGDLLVPKLAQKPRYRRGPSQKGIVQQLCQIAGSDYDDELKAYEERVDGGAAAVPFVWRVTETLEDIQLSKTPWARVGIEPEPLQHPISTQDFLRLRCIPLELARQFKATAALGRHVQELEEGTAEQLLEVGSSADRGVAILRRLLLVKAATPEEAEKAVADSEGTPIEGDLAFLMTDSAVEGVYEADADGHLIPRPERERINRPPGELLELFERARGRLRETDRLRPGNAIAAGRVLLDFMEGSEHVTSVQWFPHFYDRFIILPKKVSMATPIAARALPPNVIKPPVDVETDDAAPGEEEGEGAEEITAENLLGLTISAVESKLGDVKLPREVIAEAVTALRSGKHLLLSGPPGTGKSRLAVALSEAVVGPGGFQMSTATADWTTFDTIGGYIPRGGGDLGFEAGVVLRALQRSNWLIIDEINRADIDKAFGPLFTLLSSSGENGTGQSVTLPYKSGEANVRIVWAESGEDAASPYLMTPNWRLLGTMNIRDKAALFDLSFAFLRRFAVVDVPVPDESSYRKLFQSWLSVADAEDPRWVNSAMALALGPVKLGPAILKDIATFTSQGRTEIETESDSAPYEDTVSALLTAIRLYAVPQYEGAEPVVAEAALQSVKAALGDDLPSEPWAKLEEAMEGVQLA